MKTTGWLKKRGDYVAVFEKSEADKNQFFIIRKRSNDLNCSRIGLVVSRRLGGAVKRNRTKRRLREIIRSEKLKAGWDIVIVARKDLAEASFADAKRVLGEILGRTKLVEE
jgi:ribonuclease P protein component